LARAFITDANGAALDFALVTILDGFITVASQADLTFNLQANRVKKKPGTTRYLGGIECEFGQGAGVDVAEGDVGGASGVHLGRGRATVAAPNLGHPKIQKKNNPTTT